MTEITSTELQNDVSGKRAYSNPLPYSNGELYTAPDPFLLEYRGRYYCYATGENGVSVSESDDLVLWRRIGFAFVEKGRHQYWAPSVILINGTFYMYVSNMPAGSEDAHQEVLRVAISESPTGPFKMIRELFDVFAIDSQVFRMPDGRLYLIYADNQAHGLDIARPGTSVMADVLVTPLKRADDPKAVIVPSLDREIFERNRFGDGRDWYTVEGGTFFTKRDHAFVTYSGNAFEHEDYFVGYAQATLSLDARNKAESMKQVHFNELKWKKKLSCGEAIPILQKNAFVEGTGHNSVIPAPNEIDDWIVYHGRSTSKARVREEQRTMRIDPIFYCDNGLCVDGPSEDKRDIPRYPDIEDNFDGDSLDSRWSVLSGKGTYAKNALSTTGTKPFFGLLEQTRLFSSCRISVWMKSAYSALGNIFGVVVQYVDSDNFTLVEVNEGAAAFKVITCVNSISRVLYTADLSRLSIDFSYWHKCVVDYAYGYIDVRLDNMNVISCQTACTRGCIGLWANNTEAQFSAFKITEHIDLWGNRIADLGNEIVPNGGMFKFEHNGVAQVGMQPASLCFARAITGMQITVDAMLESKDSSMVLSLGNARLTVGWGQDSLSINGNAVISRCFDGMAERIRDHGREGILRTARIECDEESLRFYTQGRCWTVDAANYVQDLLECTLNHCVIHGYERTSIGSRRRYVDNISA
jgi:GH43 family beta-xylosidase